MVDLSNEELKNILENRIKELENSPNKEIKSVDEESVKFIIKTLGLPNDFAEPAKKVLELSPRLSVIWLHLCECTGCSESLLRTSSPDFSDLIFDFISLEYHETIMNSTGWQAEDNLEKTLENKDYILAVEGGVNAIDTFFFTVGGHGKNSHDTLQNAAKNAKAIFAMGTCSSYGGIQAAAPNPTKACGISEVLTQPVVNIPGCPPSDVNMVASLVYYAIFKVVPNLDENNRPKWAYGKCLHDMCERKAKFESGEFAQEFDDELAKNGACLFKVGCKGPYTFNNCPKVKFNAKTSWPVASGHGCMACSEPNFWDEFGVYEKPMANIFAYTKNSLNNDKTLRNFDTTTDDLKSKINDEIVIDFSDPSGILYKNENGEICNFLNLEFESNLKLIFQIVGKTKLGAKLVENYAQNFKENYDFVMANYDETPMPSNSILKFIENVSILVNGKKPENLNEFFKKASEYSYKHPSPFYFKLSVKENASLDIEKSLRMPLIYLLGGMDEEGINFSVVLAFAKHLIEAAKIIDQNKEICLNIDENLNSKFLQAAFLKFL